MHCTPVLAVSLAGLLLLSDVSRAQNVTPTTCPSNITSIAGCTLIGCGIMTGVGHPGRDTFGIHYWEWIPFARNVSAVTGACLAIRKELFDRLGGFDPAFPVNYNDADLCMAVVMCRVCRKRAGPRHTARGSRRCVARSTPTIIRRPCLVLTGFSRVA